jgi:hypothetical protein
MSAPSWFGEARERAQRRKSRWNMLLLLALPLWGVLWWGGFRLVWAYHVRLYPAHAGMLGQFWPRGIGARAFAASLLMVFAPMIPAVVFAFLITNLVVWLVAPARRALEGEAVAVPGTGFRESQRRLALGAVIAVPAGVLLGAWGASLLTSLK